MNNLYYPYTHACLLPPSAPLCLHCPPQDQFLESLLEKGITDIVRIGSKSKSSALEQYNLFMLKRGRLANNEFRRKMSLESEERESKDQVRACLKAYTLA